MTEPAEEGTRDYEIAQAIGKLETEVGEIGGTVSDLLDEAESVQADAHALLYLRVAAVLAAAQRQLGVAHGLMLEGIPE